jgi:ribonuclease BN (tRNA processing enzyme)
MASSPQRLKRVDDAEVFTTGVFTTRVFKMRVFKMRRTILNCSLATSLILGLIFGTLDISLESGGAASQESVRRRTQIVLLGTGTPNADPDRSGPSVAIVVGDTPYIVDFGPGVVRRAAAAFEKGVAGLMVAKLKTAFVTHLHSDHTVGYPDLIFTPWTLERKEPLEVYGPAGLKAMTGHILKAYKEDIDVRINGLEPSNHTGYKVNAHEIKPGVIFKDQNVTVKAFRVHHGSWREAFGYRFETQDRTIVISGDCTPSESVIENCNPCDVLIHEVYCEAGLAKRPPEWQKYHKSFHTSSRSLAEIATKAKPGLLILYHQLFWGTTEEDLIKEIQQGYSGPVASGRDLDVY